MILRMMNLSLEQTASVMAEQPLTEQIAAPMELTEAR
jgi:hypothetical protein